MVETLSGLRVIELGTGPVTGMAGMILADFGAEVIRILPPKDRPLAGLNAAPMWARGKHDLTLDLNQEDHRIRLSQLLDCADVFVTNWRASVLQRKQLDAATIRAARPHLIYGHISGFGPKGALADLPGYEHVVAAYAGRMMLFQGLVDRPGPVFSALQVGIHIAIQSAVAGILAARLRQQKTRQGGLVETSILQGMLPYEMGGLIGQQFADDYQVLLPYMTPGSEPPPASLYYHPAQAGDGQWMQFGNLLPHLFDAFLIATDLIDILADPDYEAKQLLFTDPVKHEAFRERMLTRIQDRSADDWMTDIIADGGIVAAKYETTQAALTNPDIVANGHVVASPAGVQIGPLAKLTKTPAVIGTHPAEADDCVKQWLAAPRSNDELKGESAKGELPLAGIRILDLSTIIAAPIGVSALADMGAEVIKVEPLSGDPFRGLLGGLGASRVNAGKRSISVDLKTDAGRAAVRELAYAADVLVHNYRPGVPERLGIGYEQISADNPGIVYVQNNGYGPDGPSANRPSTHPVPGAAMGGVMYQLGERVPTDLQDVDGLRKWTARLMRANELNPDPNTGAVMASAIMLGLNARQLHGTGQQILVDMLGANAYANADDFLDYPGKPDRPMPDELLLGLSPTYRLYPCQDEHWVFLAAVSDAEKKQLKQALDIEELTAEELAKQFQTQSADAWQEKLIAEGIACVRADKHTPAGFWLQDEQVRENGFVGQAEHPTHGPYLRHGPVVIFDGEIPTLLGPPLSGQHTEEILAHGFDS